MRLIPRFPDVQWRVKPKRIIIRYGIRRIKDGYYMPQPKGRDGRGGSFMEPEDPTAPFIEVRLFNTERAARSALVQWCRGKHHHVVVEAVSWRESPIPSDADEYTDIEEVPGRKREDFEIVPIKVHLP